MRAFEQEWKQVLNSNVGEIWKEYSLDASDKYHSAGAKLTLFKSGRFKFRSYYPLGEVDSSAGNYSLHGDTVILNSDFQLENLKIALHYPNSKHKTERLKRLPLPVNLKGDTCYYCSYSINNNDNRFYPSDIEDGEIPDKISTLKVNIAGNDFSSEWISVDTSYESIKSIILMTDIDLSNYRQKLLTNYRFLILRDSLKDLTLKL